MLRRLVICALAGPALGWAEPVLTRGSIDFVRTLDSVRDFARPKSLFGKLVEIVAGPAENVPALVRPYALTEDSTGRLLVADPGQRVVHIFDFEKHSYYAIKGPRKIRFVSPVGIAMDGHDNIYVTDSARARVDVFDRRGKPLRTIGEPGPGAEFARPTGLAIDGATNSLYVVDTLRHHLAVLDLEGRLKNTIGRRGTGPGEFNYPTGIAINQGKLHVVDAMNFRIQTLSAGGRWLSSFGRLGNRGGTLNRPKGIGVDSDGHLYVVDALFEIVQVFDGDGRLLYYFGATGAAPGQFTLPAGIYISPRDRIYIADSQNHRIQVFRYRRIDP